MSKRNLFFLLFIAISFLIATGITTKSGISDGTTILAPIVAGRNVNMVSGTSLPGGDPYLQRQNEPSIAVSTINQRNLLAGANDYRTVDMAESEGELPGMPEGAVAGDAWLGVFKSFDGGQSWVTELLPGYPPLPQPEGQTSQLLGFAAASDPTVRAFLDGIFLYSGIAFDREENGRSVVFVARYQDIGNDIVHDVTNIIDLGTSGQFADKPWIGVDIPRQGYPNGIAYIVYSIFLGELQGNIHSKILIARSTDGGKTWEPPIKLSESQQKNQGTTIAIDPNDGTIYVAWRRFASVNVTDAMLIAKSGDFGLTFTKAVEASPSESIFFDQPTYDPYLMTSQFRTYAFPTMTVDNNHQIYMAWSERVDGPEGEARIVVRTSIDGGNTFPDETETIVDDYSGHQFMPSLTFAAGKLMIAWYDSRDSVRIKKGGTHGKLVTDDYIGPPPCDRTKPDDPCNWRQTIDVRATQGVPGNPPQFDPSIQVSRYLYGIYGGELIQMQYNPPNYPLFKGGTVAFHGDYLDIAPAPLLIKEGESWRFNTKSTDPSDFYVSWTDNRDVHPPEYVYAPDPSIDPWTLYNAPDPEKCESGFHTGMRNQNIYVSKITQGIEVGVLASNILYKDKQVFVIYIKNNTGAPDGISESITFNLKILPPSEGSVSFSPIDPQLTSLTVTVPEHSSVSRQVFVKYSGTDPIMIEIVVTGAGFTDSIYLNVVGEGLGGENKLIIEDLGQTNWESPDWIPSEYDFVDPNIVNPNIVNLDIVDPNIVNPNIVNPNIVNPNIVNPNIVNPNIVNPNIVNPNIVNPNIVNPNIVNPNIVNPNIVNVTYSDPDIIDKFWRVKNAGGVASSYTFKTIAGDSLPEETWVFTQLLVYKVYMTPGASAETCYLQQEVHHELILNIVDPNLTPDISSYDKIVDPELTYQYFWNATFSLAPGEEAIVILRVIDTKQEKPGGGSLMALTNDDDFNPASYAENVGAVAISHSSTVGDPVTAITLMILPDSLPDGKAGKDYVGAPLRAIGGTEPYTSWVVIDGRLPEGLTLNAMDVNGKIYGVISGMPKEAGDFSFTVQVTDFSSETDTQRFSLHINKPDPLTLTMNPDPPLSGTKFASYSGLTFIASKGVPPYAWSVSGAPAGLSPIEQSDGTLKLQGTPQLAGDFSIMVTVTDDYRPTPNSQPKTFTLCVMPRELEIRTQPSPLPQGFLGVPYTATLLAINAERLSLDWKVTGLPPGLELSNQEGNPVDIAGTPVYKANTVYPKTYEVTVEVTDYFVASCYTRFPHTETFSIVINPKAPVWAVEGEYNGTATAVAVDSEGNVYVTGYKIGASSGNDYYTVKYDKDGTKQWAVPYNGPGNGSDVPTSIVVDSSGVYVTGSSVGTTSGPDIYTAKYSASGALIWEKRYDGPAHLGDYANALAVDSLRNVYVTGYNYRGQQVKHADYVTIKYDSSGKMVWDQKYDDRRNGNDQATAIALLEQGGNVFVYVTGKSQDSTINDVSALNYDYFTLKYNSSGKVLWEARYDGGAQKDDEAAAIIVDSLGYAYVTGRSKRTGIASFDVYTVKYGQDGKPQWGAYYNGGYDDSAKSLALDGSGNVYVTGTSMRANNKSDFLTIKYDMNGNLGWPMFFGGEGDDGAVSIAFDSSSDAVFVAGFETSPSNGKDFLVLKCRSDNGSIVWIAKYDGPSHKDDEPTAMALNSSSIFVTGSSDKGTQKVYLTVKFSK